MSQRQKRILSGSIAALMFAAAAASAGAAQAATAKMVGPDGKDMGTVTLTQTPSGVMINANLTNLSPGGHGFHIHEKGSCSPDFKAAGGHYNPDGKEHGLNNPSGHHAGDMPNIFVNADGTVQVEILNAAVTLGDGNGTLFDEDGSAFIVHEKPDSHAADPGAGGRVACGVIEK